MHHREPGSDWAGAGLVGLKLTHFPEAQLASAAAYMPPAVQRVLSQVDLSFSPLHSHCLWHLGVWACQMLNLYYYREVLAL